MKKNKKKQQNPNNIHFLHIGKCAGTQINHLIEQINDASSIGRVIEHKHDFFLKNLKGKKRYFFSLRDPISRFKSGFYSRKRKGMPRRYSDWSIYDQKAFQDFEHANDLAESLFAHGNLGRDAFGAMKSIRHTAQNQSDWVYCKGNFLNVNPPVWIVRVEHFDKDFENFIKRSELGVAFKDLNIARDPLRSHSNDYTDSPELSDKAKDNLAKWYLQDFEFYKTCEHWLNNQS